jgi:penicillin amidase
MFWKVPTHNLICGDKEGNIAFQLSGLTPDRNGWNGRLPVPGDGRYEWVGFRSDLPREMNPERGYITTANDNSHPKDYKGRPVMYHSTAGVDVARITRLHQILSEPGRKFGVEDHKLIQHDVLSLRAVKEKPLFQGWTSSDPEVERARQMIADWDDKLTLESVPGALYVRWTENASNTATNPRAPAAERQAAIEEALDSTIAENTRDWGEDWTQWRYGREHVSDLPHALVPQFSLEPVERPGGFNTVNADGANFRRIIDLSNIDNSVWSNAPGQSGQPGSPFYGDMREHLANGQYFPIRFSRAAVDAGAAHTLTLRPGG